MMPVITISRQFGSRGDEVAKHLCELLAYGYFDKQLLAYIASKVGLPEEEIVDFSEDHYKVRSLLDHLIVGWRSPHSIAGSDIWQEELFGKMSTAVSTLDEEQSLALVQSAIRAAYRHSDMVIVGRGGQAILNDKPDVLHVRIEAPLDIRRRRLQEREKLTLAAAQDRVVEHDRASAQYLKRFYNIDWSDPLHYHLTINTNTLSVEAAARLIVKGVDHLTPDSPD
jgi:cytidylate kinase